MGALGRLLYRQARSEAPDHRTEVVLAKLDAAVLRFEQSKQRVDSILDSGQQVSSRTDEQGTG